MKNFLAVAAEITTGVHFVGPSVSESLSPHEKAEYIHVNPPMNDISKLALYDDAIERADEGDRIIKDLRERLAKSQAAQEWDEDGEPLTIGAAAADAVLWLEWMRDRLAEDKSHNLDQTRASLARCAQRLDRLIISK